MPDYSQGKIYRIRSKNCPDVYIGGTIQSLLKRYQSHNRDFRRYLKCDTNNYVSSFEILAWGDDTIELIEDFPCNTRKNLEEREKYWIQQEDCCININNQHRTVPNYYNSEASKKYRDTHKDIIKQHQKLYYQLNREKLIAYSTKYIKKQPDREKHNESNRKYKLKLKLKTTD